jgi:hypothetical protein
MRILFAFAALTLAACNPSAPDPDAAAKLGPAESLERTLPAEGDAPRYVGLWAVARDNCPDAAWTFRADGISTKGEVSCTFNNVAETETGYAIDATCTAEGPPAPHQIQLAFAESARAMLLTGGPWAGESTGLVYCGPLAPG